MVQSAYERFSTVPAAQGLYNPAAGTVLNRSYAL
jgi:hypothetical protein